MILSVETPAGTYTATLGAENSIRREEGAKESLVIPYDSAGEALNALLDVLEWYGSNLEDEALGIRNALRTVLNHE